MTDKCQLHCPLNLCQIIYLFCLLQHRELMERLEEAETANNHLLKRLDKLKNAKSAILKDL